MMPEKVYEEDVEFIEFPILQEQFEEVFRVSMDEKLIEENGQSYKVAKKSYTERDVVSIQIFKAVAEVIRNRVGGYLQESR